jgi:hypothetical protein
LRQIDHDILRTKLCRSVGATRVDHALLVADLQPQSASAHGGEVGAAGNEADVGARAREFDTEIATDRAGAVDADFHGVSSN